MLMYAMVDVFANVFPNLNQFHNTRVLTPKQYEPLIRLLDTFAKHLASCSQMLVLHAQNAVARRSTFAAVHCQ